MGDLLHHDFVRCTRDGQVAVVTLDRPAKLNTLTPAMLDELEAVARSLEADAEVRVVVPSPERAARHPANTTPMAATSLACCAYARQRRADCLSCAVQPRSGMKS